MNIQCSGKGQQLHVYSAAMKTSPRYILLHVHVYTGAEKVCWPLPECQEYTSEQLWNTVKLLGCVGGTSSPITLSFR